MAQFNHKSDSIHLAFILERDYIVNINNKKLVIYNCQKQPTTAVKTLKEPISADDGISSKKQLKILKKLLAKARFDNKPEYASKVEKCGDTRCGTCQHIETGLNTLLQKMESDSTRIRI